MSVEQLGPRNEYQCLSSDEDVLLGEYAQGSTLHYVDTGETFVFFNDGWEPDKRLIYAIQQSMGAA